MDNIAAARNHTACGIWRLDHMEYEVMIDGGFDEMVFVVDADTISTFTGRDWKVIAIQVFHHPVCRFCPLSC